MWYTVSFVVWTMQKRQIPSSEPSINAREICEDKERDIFSPMCPQKGLTATPWSLFQPVDAHLHAQQGPVSGRGLEAPHSGKTSGPAALPN